MSDRSTSPVGRREKTAQRPSAYSGGHFFEIHIGDVYQGHYIVFDKLGYGSKFILSIHRYHLQNTDKGKSNAGKKKKNKKGKRGGKR
ncbi:hypothetical protein E6O75_ATG05325 [Venturia nashicola]|uniref:Uncharacterized protein n=1 Tax=Venturia nashicola TaxID=86259 RepID=A0A4Z1P7Q7_9PEZI|nr:hypothetical protein E6O75_ATG05325 [Venturia nashicola]